MSEDLGEARLRLTTDTAALDKGLDAGELKTKASVGRMAATLGKLKTVVGPSLLQGVGLGAGLGATQLLGRAVDTVTDAIGASIGAASDLNETMSKSTAVFGSNAAAVSAWGDTSDRAMGLSKNAAIGAAAGFGDLFNKLGLGPAKAVSMSEALVGLSADLASFNNLDPTEVLDKLKSGLAGESEPLRSMGVFLNEAKVKAKAMELGLADANGELSDGAKVQARYALILQESTSAQGDFARTSDQLANSQRIVNAELENASAKIGTSLTPAVTKLETFLANDFIPTALNTADVLANVLGAALKPVGDNVDAFDRSAADAIITLIHLNDAIGGIPVPWHAAADAITTGAGKARDDFRGMGRGADDLVPKLDDVAAAEKRVGTAAATGFGTAATWWGAYRDAAAHEAERLISDAFQPTIDADRLMALNAEIAAQRRIIASRSATKAEKADARAALHQMEMDQASALLAMAEAGQTNNKGYKDGLANLKKEIQQSSGAARAALQGVLDKIQDVADAGANIPINISVNGPAHASAHKKRAAGGPTSAGETYMVGEYGPELWSSPGNGYVTDAATLAAAAAFMRDFRLPRLTDGLARAAAGVLRSPSRSIAADMGAVPAAAGDTYYQVKVDGLLKARDPFEVATQLRRVNDLRTLTKPDRME